MGWNQRRDALARASAQGDDKVREDYARVDVVRGPSRSELPGAGAVITPAPVVQGAGRLPLQAGDGGANPTLALHSLRVQPVPMLVARRLLERVHYLHSLPGGTCLAFGAFLGPCLLGALTLGVGPKMAHCLVDGASPDDCLTLTRLWLSDELPQNCESRFLGIALRALKRSTTIKFLLTYADPSQGHLGTIYQATNWLYTGLSEAMPLYDIGDGKARHSRSLSHAFGTHSVRHFAAHGVTVKVIPQAAKHRYIYFLDRTWEERLAVPVLPYPKKEALHGDS